MASSTTNEESGKEKSNKKKDGTAGNDRDDDDEEEEDEDYNPELDEDNKREEEKDRAEGDQAMAGCAPDDDFGGGGPHQHHLSTVQVMEVDRAFERIFGYRYGQAFELPQSTSLSRRDRILVNALGSRSAAAAVLRDEGGSRLGTSRKQLPHRSSASATYRKPRVGSVSSQRQSTVAAAAAAAAAAAGGAAKDDGGKASNGAGRAAEQPPAAAASGGGGGGGVDRLLKDLAGPAKVSTIKKTSSDWENFKADTGLQAKLEEQAQSKDAYLVKQDFLTRVDHRQFEVEKKGRDVDRAKRGI